MIGTEGELVPHNDGDPGRYSEPVTLPAAGTDVDNDAAFINTTLVNYCRDRGIELTRSRAYKKNDQAWIEQKNGSVVRRMVGYGRLEGMEALEALAELHRAPGCMSASSCRL
jgi:hypothetical protein